MANVQGMCTSFKQELMNGSHALGTQGANSVRTVTTKDVLKAALFFASGSRGVADTVYNTTGEATGTGYSAGGITVTNPTVPTTSGTTAFWTPSALVYTTVTIAAFDCMVLYNSSSTSSLEIAVYTFGSQSITAGTFTLTMPTNDATNGLVRVA